MLISKRSRRKSERFESRFRGGEGADFPVRQYLRCREDLTSGIVHVLLLVAFCFMLVVFGGTLSDLFARHGAHLNAWWRRVALAALGIFALSVLRRLYYKVMELREIRREMARLKGTFRLRDEADDHD